MNVNKPPPSMAVLTLPALTNEKTYKVSSAPPFFLSPILYLVKKKIARKYYETIEEGTVRNGKPLVAYGV
jgi:hypothetical protein